jgi:hypothetical protein
MLRYAVQRVHACIYRNRIAEKLFPRPLRTTAAAAPPQVMDASLQLHDTVLRLLLHHCGGYEVTTEGDSFTVVFHDAVDAVKWCLSVQQVRPLVPAPLCILVTGVRAAGVPLVAAPVHCSPGAAERLCSIPLKHEFSGESSG